MFCGLRVISDECIKALPIVSQLTANILTSTCSLPPPMMPERTITMPGVQNPHWEPCIFAIRSWTGCGFEESPIPSTVMTCLPSTLTSGARHALTEAWYVFLVVGLYCETT